MPLNKRKLRQFKKDVFNKMPLIKRRLVVIEDQQRLETVAQLQKHSYLWSRYGIYTCCRTGWNSITAGPFVPTFLLPFSALSNLSELLPKKNNLSELATAA
jgi:hypothetical protein